MLVFSKHVNRASTPLYGGCEASPYLIRHSSRQHRYVLLLWLLIIKLSIRKDWLLLLWEGGRGGRDPLSVLQTVLHTDPVRRAIAVARCSGYVCR